MADTYDLEGDVADAILHGYEEGPSPWTRRAAARVLALLKERGATAEIDGPIYLSSDDSERIGVGTVLVVLLEEAPYDEDELLGEAPYDEDS